MLEEHNKLRSIHLSPPLVKNRNMSLQAKELAIQLASEANLRHSDKSTRMDQGENLAMGCTSSGPGITAKDAAKEWLAFHLPSRGSKMNGWFRQWWIKISRIVRHHVFCTLSTRRTCKEDVMPNYSRYSNTFLAKIRFMRFHGYTRLQNDWLRGLLPAIY